MADDKPLEQLLEDAIQSNAQDDILKYFRYNHLRQPLYEVSQQFAAIAVWTVVNLPRNAERSTALRKLLEGKDAAVRTALALA